MALLGEQEMSGTFTQIGPKTMQWLLPLLLSLHTPDEQLQWLKTPDNPYWGPPVSPDIRRMAVHSACISPTLSADFLSEVIRQDGADSFFESAGGREIASRSTNPVVLLVLEQELVRHLDASRGATDWSSFGSLLLSRFVKMDKSHPLLLVSERPLGAWLLRQNPMPPWAEKCLLSSLDDANLVATLRPSVHLSFEQLLSRMSGELNSEQTARHDASSLMYSIVRQNPPTVVPAMYLTRLIRVCEATPNSTLLGILVSEWIFHPQLDPSEAKGLRVLASLLSGPLDFLDRIGKRRGFRGISSPEMSHPRLLIPRLSIMRSLGHLNLSLKEWFEAHPSAVATLEPQDVALLFLSPDKDDRLLAAALLSQICQGQEQALSEIISPENGEVPLSHESSPPLVVPHATASKKRTR